MSYGDKSMLSPQIIAFIYVLALSAVVFAEVVLSPSSPGALENSSLTFTCTYTGDETVTIFTWKRVRTNESRFANLGLINAECNALIFPVDTSLYEYTCLSSKQYTWTIKKVTKQNEGDKYQCDVDTPSPGVINSNEAIIYIQVKVTKITLKDGSTFLAGTIEVTNGIRKTLTCTASKSRPTATIIWYIGDDVRKRENVTVSTLTFTPVNSDHNKQVYCKASQTAHPDVFSSRIILYVKELATTPTITDLTTEKLEGDQIRYQCTSSQTRPVAIVTWKLGTLTLTYVQNTEQGHGNDLKSVTSIVTFTANRMDNNKTIYCETSIPGQSVVKAQEKMTVYWPPSRPRIRNDSFPFLEGQTGKSIYCSSPDYGNPTATATWTGQYGTPDHADTRKLRLPPLTYQVDKSPVKCQLKNLFTQRKGLQIQSIQVLLQVEYKTSIMSFIEVSDPTMIEITKHENSSINLQCTVDSNPGSTIALLKSSDTITSVVKSKQVSYKKEKISCDTAGIYTCVGYNDYNGETRPSKELRLYVTCSPRLYSEEDFNSQIRGAVGERVKLEIKIKAYPVPTQSDVVWSKHNGNTWKILTDNENIKINNSGLESSLMFLSVNVSDFQLYSTNISNEYGTLHKEFYLQPYGKPNPPENVNYLDGSLEQTSVIITWKPGFHGGLNQTFYVTYKKQSDSSWKEITIPDKGTTRMNVTLSGLEPGTSYVFQMFSRNPEGSSDVSEILTFTTRAKTDEPGINAALIGGLLTGSVIVIAGVVVFSVFLRRKYWKKGIQRDRSESRHSGNDAYTDLQDMQSGIHIYNDFDYVNTAHDHSSSENDTNVYTVLEPNVDENKEHIYKKLELKSTPNDGQHVYENL